LHQLGQVRCKARVAWSRRAERNRIRCGVRSTRRCRAWLSRRCRPGTTGGGSARRRRRRSVRCRSGRRTGSGRGTGRHRRCPGVRAAPAGPTHRPPTARARSRSPPAAAGSLPARTSSSPTSSAANARRPHPGLPLGRTVASRPWPTGPTGAGTHRRRPVRPSSRCSVSVRPPDSSSRRVSQQPQHRQVRTDGQLPQPAPRIRIASTPSSRRAHPNAPALVVCQSLGTQRGNAR